MRIGSSPQRAIAVEPAPPPPSPVAESALRSPHAAPGLIPRERLDSIDLLRGLVMVIMALDHVRDYFTASRFDPLDLSQTTIPLALTRLITHFCAPVFVFMAGTGAYLSLSRGKTRPALSRFLLTRGIWLVFLELTFVRLAWEFNFNYSIPFVQVIWAIGWSMIVLSALVYLPSRVVGGFGVAMILTHNLFDGVNPGTLGIFGWPWQVLHVFGPIVFSSGRVFVIAYPLIPWIGVMAAGFAFGEIFTLDRTRRRKTLYAIGGALIVLFALLRGLNLYGDPQPWSVQTREGMSLISFLNCQKYPPSLLYLLMTLGPAILLLPLLEKWKGKAAGFFLVFGRVPMFYYVLHIYLIHLLAIATAAFMGLNVGFLFSAPFFNTPDPRWGFGLPAVYAFWAVTVFSLYPLCRWFAGVKSRRKDPWLSYF
jgi:uncharacterized membrane protein